MITALWTLFWIVTALLLILILTLVTPVALVCSAHAGPKPRLQIAARFFGGVTPPIRIHDSDFKAAKRQRTGAAKPKARKKPARRKKLDFRNVFAAAPQLIRDVLKAVRLRRLDIQADFGFDEPADTGNLFGLIAAVRYAIPPSQTISIAVRPDFSRACLSANVDAELSFVPATLVPPAARFAWRIFRPRR